MRRLLLMLFFAPALFAQQLPPRRAQQLPPRNPLPVSNPAPAQNPIPTPTASDTINWAQTFQTIDGFGGAEAEASASILSSSDRTFAFSQTGSNLGLSILRVGISNAGTYETGNCTTISSGCAGAHIASMQAVNAQGGKVFATPWTAPAMYKQNNNNTCNSGSSNNILTTSNYGNWATWLVNFYKSVQQFASVNIFAISEQNEPDQCQNYDSMNWTGSTLQNFMQNNMGPSFASTSPVPLLMMPEPSGYGILTNYAGSCMGTSACAQYVGINAWHDYTTTFSPPDSVSDTTNPYASQNKRYWETETGAGNGFGPNAPGCSGGQWCPGISDAMMWAAILDYRIAVNNLNAYVYWWIKTQNNDNEGLMNPQGSPTISIRAYVFGQYARFIRPNSVRIGAVHNPQSNVSVSAYKDPTSAYPIVVATNYSGSALSQQFCLSNGPATPSVTPYTTSSSLTIAQQGVQTISGGCWTYSLPGQSVTTFVGAPAGPSNPTYYIASNGSDANNGTSKTTPWAHAPGMQSYTGGHTPVAGDQYIFRGGDTWHFGNSGASPYSGGTWRWNWSGASGNTVYVGVDKTWYSGSFWNRPILNGDNPTSTSVVSSCPYQIATNGGTTNEMVHLAGINNMTFEGFELLGLCATSGTGTPGAQDYINIGGASVTLSNLYIHGMTVTYTSGSGDPIMIASNNVETSRVTGTILSGLDSRGSAINGTFNGMYDWDNSVIENVGDVIANNCHLLYNMLIRNLVEIDIGHGNTYECNGEASGTNAMYNNLFVNNVPAVNIWPEPPVGTTDYDFNNTVINTPNSGNFWNIGQNSGVNQGTVITFNNTLENPSNANVFNCTSGANHPFTSENNFAVTDNASMYGNCVGNQLTEVSPLLMNHATASADGYNLANNYSPTSSSSPTVGHGTNASAYCTTLSSAGLSAASTACLSGTNLGVTKTTDPNGVIVVGTPAQNTVLRGSSWDLGAQQFGSPTGGSPAISFSPTSLAFGSQTTGTPSAPQTFTITNGPGASANLTISSIATGGTNPIQYSETNNCPNTLSTGASCTVSVTFTPNAAGSLPASIIVTDNAAGSPHAVPLTGTGQQAQWSHVASTGNNCPSAATCTISGLSVPAGAVVDVEVEAYNTNNSASTLTSVAYGDATPFTVTTCSPSPLVAGTGMTWISYQLSAPAPETSVVVTMASTVNFLSAHVNIETLQSGYVASLDACASSLATVTPGTLINTPTFTPSTAQEDVFTAAIPGGNYISAVGVPFTSSWILKPTTGAPQNGSAAGYAINQTNGLTNGPNMTDSSSGPWSSQIAALKASPMALVPAISSLSRTSGPIGGTIDILGSNFGATQGTSTANINGTCALTVASWSATDVQVTMPSCATTGGIAITTPTGTSNSVNFTVTPVQATLSSTSGTVNSTVTSTGTGYGTSPTVTIGTIGVSVVSSTPTTVTFSIPVTAVTGAVTICVVPGNCSNGITYTVTPTLNSITPTSGVVGAGVTFRGFTFSASCPMVSFNGTPATPTGCTPTTFIAAVPMGATTGPVSVTTPDGTSNSINFTVTPTQPPPTPPVLSSLNYSAALPGVEITALGQGFGATQGTSTMVLTPTTGPAVAMGIVSWSDTVITFVIPSGSSSGNLAVTTPNGTSNAIALGVIQCNCTTVTGTATGRIGGQP